MIVEIPDTCECTDEETCDHCRWNTACVLQDMALEFKKYD